MKVTTILKGAKDQNGQQPIQIRIADKTKRNFRPTGIKVTPEQFKKGKVVDHPKAKEYNEKLRVLIIQYQAIALTGITKETNPDFYKYVEDKINHLDRRDGTVRQYQAQISKLKRFAPSLYMKDFTHDWFNQYKKHLRGLGNTGNTIWSGFKFLNTFLSYALSDGVIKEDPFRSYEMPKYKEPEKSYLTLKEAQQLEKYLKTAPGKIKEVGYWFLIGCYTGMRISDIKNFSKKNIVGGRLVYKAIKTGEVVGLPVRGKLKELLEKVNYKAYTGHENTYNTLLKVIAPAAGIDKKISSHTARHTAAMLLADAGVSMEVTAKILGHANLKSTSVYYKISNKRIDDEMKKIKR
jgi:site-specific recombinase XerD